MANSRNNRRNSSKPKKKRANKDGTGLRIPPIALAYFFDGMRRLKFVYPITGEHPNKTIRRAAKMHGVIPGPQAITVCDNYWRITKNLPSSVVEETQVGSIFDPTVTESVPSTDKPEGLES